MAGQWRRAAGVLAVAAAVTAGCGSDGGSGEVGADERAAIVGVCEEVARSHAALGGTTIEELRGEAAAIGDELAQAKTALADVDLDGEATDDLQALVDAASFAVHTVDTADYHVALGQWPYAELYANEVADAIAAVDAAAATLAVPACGGTTWVGDWADRAVAAIEATRPDLPTGDLAVDVASACQRLEDDLRLGGIPSGDDVARYAADAHPRLQQFAAEVARTTAPAGAVEVHAELVDAADRLGHQSYVIRTAGDVDDAEGLDAALAEYAEAATDIDTALGELGVTCDPVRAPAPPSAPFADAVGGACDVLHDALGVRNLPDTATAEDLGVDFPIAVEELALAVETAGPLATDDAEAALVEAVANYDRAASPLFRAMGGDDRSLDEAETVFIDAHLEVRAALDALGLTC
jgi:hypothetical protein